MRDSARDSAPISKPVVATDETKKIRYKVDFVAGVPIRIEENVYLTFVNAVRTAMEDCGLMRTDGDGIIFWAKKSAFIDNKGEYYTFRKIVGELRKLIKENESKFSGKEEAIYDFLIWSIIINGRLDEFIREGGWARMLNYSP